MRYIMFYKYGNTVATVKVIKSDYNKKTMHDYGHNRIDSLQKIHAGVAFWSALRQTNNKFYNYLWDMTKISHFEKNELDSNRQSFF